MTFADCLRNDSTVYHLKKRGASLEEIIAALCAEKEQQRKRILELDSLTPKKTILKDGTVMVWQCPIELIPVTDDLR